MIGMMIPGSKESEMARKQMTSEEVAEMWERYRRGETVAMLARRFDRTTSGIGSKIRQAGGIQPHLACRADRHLSMSEREEISRGVAAGESFRQIARRLGRAPSTVSREVAANGGRQNYRALAADRKATEQRRRPKVCKLAASPRLRQLVNDRLEQKWSPEQISGWLARTRPDDPELQVSHETIYRTLFVQSRGALKTELTRHLRTRRRVRRPAASNQPRRTGRGQLIGTVHISERPAEAEDRAVPGHWEGDLLLGSGRTAIATLVERATRFTVLVHLDGTKSEQVVGALGTHIVTLPEQLRRSVTWDHGKEMALHADFTIDTGVQVYFCDPSSPWQRGTNENTNGLLRH
jgi:IS30 family transposase